MGFLLSQPILETYGFRPTQRVLTAQASALGIHVDMQDTNIWNGTMKNINRIYDVMYTRKSNFLTYKRSYFFASP